MLSGALLCRVSDRMTNKSLICYRKNEKNHKKIFNRLINRCFKTCFYVIHNCMRSTLLTIVDVPI